MKTEGTVSTLMIIALVAALGYMLLSRIPGRPAAGVEGFECWCRKGHEDRAPAAQSAGDFAPQLQRFAQILANSKYMVARESGTNRLYYAPLPLTPATTWKPLGQAWLDSIALSDKYVLGTNRDSSIFLADVSAGTEAVYSNPTFARVPGGLYQVAVAVDGSLWGVNTAGDIFSCPGPCTAGNWTKINGAAYGIGFDAATKSIWLRGTDNGKYTCALPCTGQWVKQ